MGKYIFLLVCCFLAGGAVNAQENYAVDTVIVAPEEDVKVEPAQDYEEGAVEEDKLPADTFVYLHPVSLGADTLTNIRDKKQFGYVRNLDSLLKASQEKQQKQQKVNTPKGPSFMDGVLGGPVFRFILWTLALCFVAIIIYQLLKGNGLFQKKTVSRKVKENDLVEEELMEQNDFDSLISKALAEQDYRSAVRFHFIKTLQQLRDKNHIVYEADKTNNRYVYEVPQHLRNDFSRLIFQYEYVWYGHFDINQEQYYRVRDGFNKFYPLI
ncbi:MAG: hypothetical protein QM687_14790 [Ferruginibacter sp.]